VFLILSLGGAVNVNIIENVLENLKIKLSDEKVKEVSQSLPADGKHMDFIRTSRDACPQALMPEASGSIICWLIYIYTHIHIHIYLVLKNNPGHVRAHFGLVYFH
jgi:hypothetical protein